MTGAQMQTMTRNCTRIWQAASKLDARSEHVRASRTHDRGESRAHAHTHAGMGADAHVTRVAAGVREEAAASARSSGAERGAPRSAGRCRWHHEQHQAECSLAHTPPTRTRQLEEAKREGNCFPISNDSQRRCYGRGCLRRVLRVGEIVAVMMVLGFARLDVVEGQAASISSLKPMNGPPTGGFTLTVTGVDLASADLSFGIRVGGSSCESTTWTR